MLPAVATAQPWLEAYKARDYLKAASLLHDIVSEPEFMLSGHDPAPLRLLAQLYREGLGVGRDSIAACALAQDAELATQMTPPKQAQTLQDFHAYEAGMDAARQFVAASCSALTEADLLTASRARAGCYALGMPEELMTVGAQTVRLSHFGIAPVSTPLRDLGGFGCPLAIAQVRLRTVAPPEDAPASLKSRHFVEMFVWRRNNPSSAESARYGLSWQIYERRDGWMVPIVDEVVASAASLPLGPPPSDLDARLTLAMVRSGHVLWRIAGTPPKRGWLMLELKESR